MSWVYLIAAGLCEIFYAAAMPRTEGFTRLWPSLFCAAFIAASMYLLSLATRSIPVGTAYAVWVGIGAVGTAIYGVMFLGEDRSLPRMACFAMILMGIVGLKFLSLRGDAA
ncbi:multidrug efflux SMR transporter [Comamonas sp. Y33R10-2]|uniref:DMT family transporter n=1 Tax=Comamonas sp. Y33R10-2 TaxID=2853257 RepID=UPI001C5C859C|nr:multidrug efflux SMR transporter [Comamonas sp. Y33R10-2]QXZ09088.1 multidrug efflux SMR transporter [Comamonas sp. Y33R10-2]